MTIVVPHDDYIDWIRRRYKLATGIDYDKDITVANLCKPNILAVANNVEDLTKLIADGYQTIVTTY